MCAVCSNAHIDLYGVDTVTPLFPEGETDRVIDWQKDLVKKFNKDIWHKCATPMKFNSSTMLGSKKLELIIYNS
jgi:hypothetical protein